MTLRLLDFQAPITRRGLPDQSFEVRCECPDPACTARMQFTLINLDDMPINLAESAGATADMLARLRLFVVTVDDGLSAYLVAVTNEVRTDGPDRRKVRAIGLPLGLEVPVVTNIPSEMVEHLAGPFWPGGALLRASQDEIVAVVEGDADPLPRSTTAPGTMLLDLREMDFDEPHA